MPRRKTSEVRPSGGRATGGAKARPAARARRNLPAGERAEEMLEAALALFSERGMRITIQGLADRVSVTQPLVHRYFPTKADLISAICTRITDAHWDPAWQEILTDRARPLETRISDFYQCYLPHIYSSDWYRGFLFVALHDPRFAEKYLGKVENNLLLAIIDEMRRQAGFPTIAATPPHEREIELVWGMHSTMVFHGVRRYVYESNVGKDVPSMIRDQAAAYLHMAPRVMAELMPPKRSAKAAQPRRAGAY
jgi:AcrR family transcriptional regulator